jgi:hypothetical protein
MRKLIFTIILFLGVISIVAYAEEASQSPFIGSWEGQWSDMTGFTKLRFPGSFSFVGDGKGGVILQSWVNSSGKSLEIKKQPMIEQRSQDELLIVWPNGNKTSFKLDGSVIRAENNPVSGRPWVGTFFREKGKQ